MRIERDGRAFARMLVAAFSAFACLALAFPAALRAQGVTAAPGTARDGRPKVAPDGYANERKVLLGGKATTAEIAIVVAKLARDDDAKAHGLLRETLAAVPDRVLFHTAHEILRTLVRELGVDVDARLREKERARVEARLPFYVAYVAPLADLCVRQSARILDARDPFAIDCRAYLVRLPTELRRSALTALWKEPQKPVARMAVLLAGRSEDPSLAPDLARLLAKPALANAAREALGDLTWRAKPFRDANDFGAWWKTHEGLSFGELTRRAAAAARELGRAHEREIDVVRADLRKRLLERSRLLLRAMLASKLPPWKEIGEVLTDSELATMRAPLFDELAGGLIARGAPEADIRPTLGELAALRDRLDADFDASAESERASLLAAWAMCAKWSGATATKQAVDRLLGFLAARGGPVPVARLFELLLQFPEDRVRAQVLAALEREENRSALSAGLACLRKLGAPTNAPLVERTLGLLESVIRDGQASADDRERALEVLGEFANVGDSALERIEAIVSRNTEKEPLADPIRLTALQWAVLQSGARMQKLTNGHLLEHAKGQLEFLFSCLDDASPRLRQEGAKALAVFPSEVAKFTKAQVEDYGRKIVARVGRALVTESSLGCARQEIDALVRQAERAKISGAAISHLVAALSSWSRDEVQRRNLLIPLRPRYRQDLAALSKGATTSAALLVQLATRFGEARLYYEQALVLRAPAFSTLEAELLGAKEELDPDAPQIATKRAEFILALSELRIEGATGAELIGGDLARLATSAAEGMRLLSVDRPQAGVLLAECYLAKSDSEQAERVLADWRKAHAANVSDDLRRRAALVAARAMIASGKPREVAKLLAEDRRPIARLVVAEALLAAALAPEALQELRPLLDGTGLDASQREHARNHYLSALLKTKKFREAERLVVGWAKLPDGPVRQRRELLLRELESARSNGGGKAANGSPSPIKR